MDNVYTKGSEYAHQLGPPVNEDYSLVMIVFSVTGDIVSAYKFWDEDGATGRIFYARILRVGQAGYPPGGIAVGQKVVFHRIGEENRESGEDFVCFAENPLILIEDRGVLTGTLRKGREVYYDQGGVLQVPVWSETLELVAADPLSFFHDSTPSWSEGRVYPGTKLVYPGSRYYLGFLAGYGDAVTPIVHVAGGVTFTLSIDGQGNVLDFTAT